MASTVAFLIVASALMGYSNIAIAREESEIISVSGQVMCQDCTKSFEEWLHGDRPVKGGKVSLTCMDDRKKVVYYDSSVTDDSGKYQMVVNKKLYGKKLDEKLCSVRLVSSPDSTCNVRSNFGNGKSGEKLGQPVSMYRNIVRYVLGNFYFTTPLCEIPDTNRSI